MGSTTGRVAQARALLIRAAEMANESGKHEVKLKVASKAIAFSTRQCCYAAQRAHIRQIMKQAEADGRDTEKALRETLLDGVQGEFTHVPPSTWPGASIIYRKFNGEHFLIIQFRRIASDPLWADMLTQNLSVGAPDEKPANTQEILEEFK